MLTVADLSVSFGGFRALRGVSVSAAPGQIVGLVGPNGSGKSTLLDIVSGLLVPDAGEVRLDGVALPLGRPDRMAAAGIARAFQVPRLARRLTVLENAMLGMRHQPGERLGPLFLQPRAVARREREAAAAAIEVLGRLDLSAKANDDAGALSGGQQKLLSMGMLLMAQPRLLLLDEPAAGVNPVLIDVQVRILRELRAEGRIVVLVEHNMEMVADVCDRIFVLDAGEVIAEGTPAEIHADDRVMRSYLGQRT